MATNGGKAQDADPLIRAEEGYLGDAKVTNDNKPNNAEQRRVKLKRYPSSMEVELSMNDNESIEDDVPDSVTVDAKNVFLDATSSSLTGRGAVHDSNTKITLRDLLQNPYEDEAETAILNAIESRMHERDGSANILPNITEESQKLFQQQEDTAPTLKQEESALPSESKNRTISMGDASLMSFRSIKTYQSNTFHGDQNLDNAMTRKMRADTLSDMAEQMRIVQMRTLEGPSETGFLARAAKNVAQPPEERRATAIPVDLVSATPVELAAAQPPPGFEAPSTNSLYKHAEQLYTIETKTTTQIPHSILRNRTKTESAGVGPILPHNDNLNGTDRTTDDSPPPKSFDTGDEDKSIKENKTRKRVRCREWIISFFAITRKWFLLEWEILKPLFRTDIDDVKTYIKRLLILFTLVLIVASVLFYGFQNPIEQHTKASYSWWLLFVLIRQVITFTLAKVTQYLFIDFIAMRTFLIRKYLGPVITLFVIQAKGWAFLFVAWSAWDFLLLYGDRKFCNHWLFDQKRAALFNEMNPSGIVLTSKFYSNLLVCGIVGGLLGALKKVWIAWYLGRRKFEHYGRDAEKLMKRMLLLSDVAQLSREIYFAAKQEDMKESLMENRPFTHALLFAATNEAAGNETEDKDDKDDDDDNEEDEDENEDEDSSQDNDKQTETNPAASKDETKLDYNKATETDADSALRKRSGSKTDVSVGAKSINSMKSLTDQFRLIQNDKNKLYDMIGEWEEPSVKNDVTKKTSISDVLQLRQALTCMNTEYPFSTLFGLAKTRNQCVESASLVYQNLLLLNPDKRKLPFETISIAALQEDGKMDEKKAKLLVKVFRPDRNGTLSLIDFIKSCDKIYKNLRIFRAALQNSAQIDEAFNTIIDIAFYFVLFLIVLQILSFNPLQVFLTLSGLFVSFAFMFGNAATNYFNGILYILVQRPYDIGDKVSFSPLTGLNDFTGSPGWFVEGITLFTTTIRYGSTNEVATFANGALTGCKVINCRRSPKANTFILIKFGVDVPYEKILLFKASVESFVKARPREWLALNAFRATRVEYDLAFVEYIISLQHVEGWQNIGPILSSKADLASYCHELAKKLCMRYEAAPLPVNLAFDSGRNEEESVANITKTLSDLPNAGIDPTLKQEVQRWSMAFSDSLILSKSKKKK